MKNYQAYRPIAVTEILRRNEQSTARFVLNQGGAGSSKSHSLAQLFIERFFKRVGYKLLITRKTLPALRISSYKLFTNLLKEYDFYRLVTHNKSERTIIYGNNLIHFTGIDDPEKIKSTEWNDIWMEEATDFDKQDFDMLKLRNRAPNHFNQMFLSYNPVSCPWLKEDVIPEEESLEVIVSTHHDNPFLPDFAKKDLENLKDPTHRKIYLEGGWGELRGLVFDDWDTVERIPEDVEWCTIGLDFGFTNDPTACIEVAKKGDDIYINELIYETGLTNQDISERLDELGIIKSQEVIADSAEPKSIEELYRLGRNVHGAKKGRDSINHGIDLLKRYRIFVTRKSVNLQKERASYKWKEDKNGILLNTPVDKYNHALDALRYVALKKLAHQVEFYVS